MDEFSNLAVRDKFRDAPRLSLFRVDEPEDTPSPGVSAGVKLTPAAESPKRSTRKAKAKQKKRPEDSPPWLHPSGRWCRKVKWGGKWRAFYFGRDESKAMAEWDRVKKYLLAGQEHPPGLRTRTKSRTGSRATQPHSARCAMRSTNRKSDWSQLASDRAAALSGGLIG